MTDDTRRRDRIDELLRDAAAHLSDATKATALCLHAKRCPRAKGKRHAD